MTRKRNSLIRIWMLALPLLLAGVVAGQAMADEVMPDPDRVRTPSMHGGTEADAGTLPILPNGPKAPLRRGIEAQLNEARKAGDTAAVRRLENRRPKSNVYLTSRPVTGRPSLQRASG